MKELCIGGKTAPIPIIQGGMGVGISLSSLAGAVAKEGGMGVISSAQIGFDEEDFEEHPAECNLRAIRKHIARAKELSCGNGLIGINVMTALRHYREHVREAAKAGVDAVICGAGLPVELPELTDGYDVKIAPVISSARALDILLRMWERKYDKTADFIVAEGPLAGGHLGFSDKELESLDTCEKNFEAGIPAICAVKKRYEEKYGRHIPLIVAGGIYSHSDIEHALLLGADGVQIASRFVATYECDAADAYKQAYVNAREEDVVIIKSPVGMPGRALRNSFVEKTRNGALPIQKCCQCLAKCNPSQIPYCITKALTDAVKGDVDNGLIFCGANVGKIDCLMSVHELMKELCGDFAKNI